MWPLYLAAASAVLGCVLFGAFIRMPQWAYSTWWAKASMWAVPSLAVAMVVFLLAGLA